MGTWFWDMLTNVLEWSPELGPIHGQPYGWVPKDFNEFMALIHADDRDVLMGAMDDAIASGGGFDVDGGKLADDAALILVRGG